MNISDLRQKIEHAVAHEDVTAAQRLLRDLWRAEPASSAASFLIQQFEKLRPRLSLLPHRLAILRSFTVEPLLPILRTEAFLAGIDLDVRLSDFNAYVQEIVDPGSGLYAFSAETIILAVQTRDIAPALWGRVSPTKPETISDSVARTVASLRLWIQTLRRQTAASLIIHNCELPPYPSAGLLDDQADSGQRAGIREINRQLQVLCRDTPGTYVLDYDGLVARYGYYNWHDERKWLTVRLPIASRHLHDMAREWLRFLHPITGKLAKVLVTDLDNTLWKGVIGEDGIDGIQLGVEYPGAAFQEVQRTLLDVYDRGILLAICSKNNFDDAMEAIEKHPGMLIGPSHFAAMRINWGDKPQNLREIAAELNVGTDALAFLDDNPLERQQVRAELLEVTVIDLPGDPVGFARAIRECPMLERLTLSHEDRERGQIYQVQRERQELQKSAVSREDFYRSLDQEVEIASLTRANLPRIAQLINKTNQFNLTTRRRTEPELLAIASSPDWFCFSIAVRDRFGDNGLVGVAITHIRKEDGGTVCDIDSFLLSCRVIGRTIETAFLWFVADHAFSRGAQRLEGWFLPTKKNAPARDFYASHAMTKNSETDGATLWAMDLPAAHLACPGWIRLKVAREKANE